MNTDNAVDVPSEFVPDGHLYIGKDVCEKASCNRKQEFPDSWDNHCIFHSLEEWHQRQK